MLGNYISISIARCLRAFNEFVQGLQHPGKELPDGLIIQDWRDELGRLRIWAANIGAHQSGQSSLDFRLRDSSHIRKQVTKLLNDIFQSLKETKDWIEDSEDDDVESLSEYSSEDENSISEAQQRCGSVAILIDCLFQMSILIRKPAQRDARIESTMAEVGAFEPFDRHHVRNKFPRAEEHLVIRLGKANTRRRQYFRYREHHAMKLTQRIDEAVGGLSLGDEGNSAILSNTLATSFPDPNIDFDDRVSDSGSSQISFAPTLTSGGAITIPAPPGASRIGTLFECPYCYYFIKIQSEESWNSHVFQDLQPYVCTELDCPSPEKLYATEHEWLHHRETVHRHQRSLSPGLGLQSEVHKCQLCGDSHPTEERQARHMARHLQELALFVLPRPDEDSDESGNDANEMADSGSRKREAGESRSLEIIPIINQPVLTQLNILNINLEQSGPPLPHP